jgi:exopolyphosphatase/pppGpp-phosphohydrolase
MDNQGITILNENSNNSDFAVLELSTKAVKLLIGPQKELVKQDSFTFRDNYDNFNFRHFFRTAEKPEAGKGLNSEMIMDMNYFNRRVIWSIKKMMSEVNRRAINKVVCVATAAYRNAKNQDEILKSIKDNCGISVKVLSKKEEAEATYFAFANSKPEYIDTDEAQILIDQGGGSSEVTFFQNNEMVQTHSLGFGTTNIQKELFNNIPNSSETLKQGFERCKLFTHSHLRDMYLEAHKANLFDTEFDLCVAVGTAITVATGKKGNPKQHCFEMSNDFLQDKIKNAEAFFEESNINTTADLKKLFDDLDDYKEKDKGIQSRLTMRLGLPMVVELLEKFSLDSLMVSGTGLWYGVYFQEIHNS